MPKTGFNTFPKFKRVRVNHMTASFAAPAAALIADDEADGELSDARRSQHKFSWTRLRNKIV